MTSPSLVERAFLLKKTQLFAELDLDLLLTVADRLVPVSFGQGEVIFPTGQNAHRMYLLVEGCVEISDESEQTLAMLYAVDYFGDEALFNEQPRAYQATSTTDSQLLTLSRTDLMHLISECPSVGIALLQAYSAGVKFRPRANPAQPEG